MYSTGWECWPIDFQQYARLSLMVLQRPCYLTGYGLLNCDLETFRLVSRNGFENILPIRRTFMIL